MLSYRITWHDDNSIHENLQCLILMLCTWKFHFVINITMFVT